MEYASSKSVESAMARAKWIGPRELDDPGAEAQPWRLFGRLVCTKHVRRAVAYVSFRGIGDLWVNGQRVGEETLAPGWLSYRHRMPVSILDIGDLLIEGRNTVGVDLADGWWRGRYGFDGGRSQIYGSDQSAIVHLSGTYVDGEAFTFNSDETWLAVPSPRTKAQLYTGEEYDARLDNPLWATNDYQPSDVFPVRVEKPDDNFVYVPSRAIKVLKEIRPVSITHEENGELLIDFGQNASARIEFIADLQDGEEITVRHAEILQQGKLYTRPLRRADAIDRFVGSGDGPRRFEPRFTVHGFRYASVTGATSRIDLDTLVMRVVGSPFEFTSSLETSNRLLNRLHANTQWSMRSNFVGIPTDCPQRDERLGWTGDIQVFGPAALTLGNCREFLSDWLVDVRNEQQELGTVPWYVPWIPPRAGQMANKKPASVWDDVAILLPWTLYQFSGDKTELEKHWDLIKSWADDLIKLAGDDHLWLENMQLGDWLDPSAPPEAPARGATDPQLVANAYSIYSLRIAQKIAETCGFSTYSERYGSASSAFKRAFNKRYVSPDGSMMSDSQTAYALALVFDLFETEDQRNQASARLANLVKENEYLIGTGFAGTPLILDALSNSGNLDAAYKLLEQTRCPSWLYPVTQGATTIWERWDAMQPNGKVNPGEMTSFNHYAFGAVVDWMYRVILGINSTTPGFSSIDIAPQPGGSLMHAQGHITTKFGEVHLSWRRESSKLFVQGRIPDGIKARLILPAGAPRILSPGDFQGETDLEF